VCLEDRYPEKLGNPQSVRTLAQLRIYLSRWASWLAIGLGEVQAFFMECLRQYMPSLAGMISLMCVVQDKKSLLQ
jgi:hypothetical protein